MRKRLSSVTRSFTAKILVVALFYLIVPLILYGKFHQADSDKREFLIRSLQSQGHLVAEALSPKLAKLSGAGLIDAQGLVAQAAGDGLRVKALLRPQDLSNHFLLMAAAPPLTPEQQKDEPQLLARMGILDRLDQSCAQSRPLAIGYTLSDGDEEFLTAMDAVHTPSGCWVIVTAYAGEFSLTRPFWAAPEVRLAVGLYAMIVIVIALGVLGAGLDLRAFTILAGHIRQRRAVRENFASVAQVPELVPVAREFDRMVGTLEASAQALRDTAADTAHALKTPIATITQALEHVRPVAAQNSRCERGLEIIDRSLTRLADLVEQARRLDEDAAQLMLGRMQSLNLADLCTIMCAAYSKMHAPRLRFVLQTPRQAWVAATPDSLETVLENLLDNAVDFSPDGGSITVTLTASSAAVTLRVLDNGPGVPPDRLTQIFKRDYSNRPNTHEGPHYGIGLAIVRRTVEILGGTVTAANRPEGGLIVTLTLPAAL